MNWSDRLESFHLDLLEDGHGLRLSVLMSEEYSSEKAFSVGLHDGVFNAL